MSDEEAEVKDPRVRPFMIARLGRKAERAGQFPLAAFLYALAVDQMEHWPDEWHFPEIDEFGDKVLPPSNDTIIEGRKIAKMDGPDFRD